MKYRADIDGLRALAVVPVVLFHFGFSNLHGTHLVPGGFVGVDIFFVISGYLITKIIHEDIAQSRYSIVGFYDRRVRRIFPALIGVYVFCVLASFALNIPKETIDISQSIVSSVFFVSNIFFSTKDSYFNAQTQLNPVLHTWSLSVEEQFYVIFPVLAYLLKNFEKKIKIGVIILLFGASLAASEVMISSNPTGSYYLVQSRAWELLLGSLLALGFPPRLSSPLLNNVLGLAGILAIVLAIRFYWPATRFPGIAALLPTLGAAAIIYAGEANPGNIASRLLGLPPIRWIGLISYSLYLWHWPLVVYYRLEYKFSHTGQLMLLVASFTAAYLSWRFIERPFRAAKAVPTDTEADDKRRKINTLLMGAAAATCVIVAALALPLASRQFWKPDPLAERYSNYLTLPPPTMGSGTCFITSHYNSFAFYKKDQCLAIHAGQLNVLVMGDSHSAQLVSGLRDTYPDVNIMQASSSGCRPIMNSKGEDRCVDMRHYIYDDYLKHNKPDIIILAGKWDPGNIPAAANTAKYLSNYAKRVYLIGLNPTFDSSLPRILARAEIIKNPEYITKHALREAKLADAEFKTYPLADRVHYISIYDIYCANTCKYTTRTGDPIDFDDNHLSTQASDEVAHFIPITAPIAGP